MKYQIIYVKRREYDNLLKIGCSNDYGGFITQVVDYKGRIEEIPELA